MRLSVSERAKLSRANRSIPVPVPVAIKPAKKSGKAEALAALQKEGGDMAKRAAMIARFEKLPPFAGQLNMRGTVVNVKNGAFLYKGIQYLVSKDGRAVLNARAGIIVGEIFNGKVRRVQTDFAYLGREV